MAADADAKGDVLSPEEVLAMVPQQAPFRFIDEIVEQITELALAHDLMTRYTSFVAVEERIEDMRT